MRSIFKVISVLAFIFCAAVFSFTAIGIYTIPDKIILTESEDYGVKNYFFAEVLADDGNAKSVNAKQDGVKVENYDVEFSLVGFFPVKTSSVIQTTRKYVVPSGEAFGIKLYTDGIVIVGMV